MTTCQRASGLVPERDFTTKQNQMSSEAVVYVVKRLYGELQDAQKLCKAISLKKYESISENNSVLS